MNKLDILSEGHVHLKASSLGFSFTFQIGQEPSSHISFIVQLIRPIFHGCGQPEKRDKIYCQMALTILDVISDMKLKTPENVLNTLNFQVR